MLKKVVVGCVFLATSSVFGMSLSQLNSATKTELMEINGIGEAKATAIIQERSKAKFKSFEDFQRVEGVGEQTAKNVKNDVKSSKTKKVTQSTTSTKTKKKS